MIIGIIIILLWIIFLSILLVKDNFEYKVTAALLVIFILVWQFVFAIYLIVTSTCITTKVITDYQQGKYIPEYTIQGGDTTKVVYVFRKESE